MLTSRGASWALVLASVAFCSVDGPRAAVPQFSSATQTAKVPAVKLDAPELKGAEAIKPSEVKSEVVRKTDAAAQGLRPESMAIVETDPASIQRAKSIILSGVPFGYGSLLKTSNAVNPGPQVGAADPRVIDLKRQPQIEVLIGQSNFLPVRFLEVGTIISKSVARVALQFEDLPTAGIATGFMVSNSLFMTNHHVIDSKDMAGKLVLDFNYQYALDGSTINAPVVYELDPTSFFYTSADLDFTVVRVKPRQIVPTAGGTTTDIQAGIEFGHIALVTSFYYSVGQLANVIQHPQGRPKEIALHENKIDGIYANIIRYTTDTEPGSSGSPVFNNSWKIIALHHSAGEQGADGKYVDNEGIRIDRIIAVLKAQPSTVIPADVLKELGI